MNVTTNRWFVEEEGEEQSVTLTSLGGSHIVGFFPEGTLKFSACAKSHNRTVYSLFYTRLYALMVLGRLRIDATIQFLQTLIVTGAPRTTSAWEN